MSRLAASPLASGDPVLARVAETVLLPPLESTGDVFHDLASCLLEQQIHYRSSKRVFAKMLERAGLDRITLGAVDTFEATALAGVTLSGGKREAFASAVAFFETSAPDWSALSDEEVRRALSEIRGVGAWTVDMILLYTLQRPDVFPVDDYHLKQVMTALYGIEPGAGFKRRLTEAAEAWRPHRSRAVRQLLAWKDWQKERRR